jgi:hypothetical protein
MPPDADEVRTSTLQAVELLTAWAEGDSSNDFLGERAKAITHEDGHEGAMRSVAGLVNVSVYMLGWLSQLTEKPIEEILQEIAIHYIDRE